MTLTQINKAGLDELALDHVFTIGASGSSAYTFQGEGLNGTVNNPTLYLTRGKTYRFENGSGGHPIRIQSTSGASGTAYNTGVTNNAGSGTVIVEVQHDAPDVLYYQCTSHAAMNGILYITGALADGGVTTAKIAAGAVTVAKIGAGQVQPINIQASAIGESKIANNAVTVTKIADNSIVSGKILDHAVTLAKLELGTSSNDGKFLRANNGGDPSFETISTTPADGSITEAKLASEAVTNAKIQTNAVDDRVLASNSVVTGVINNGAVTTDKIGNDQVTTAKIANEAITSAKIIGNSTDFDLDRKKILLPQAFEKYNNYSGNSGYDISNTYDSSLDGMPYGKGYNYKQYSTYSAYVANGTQLELYRLANTPCGVFILEMSKANTAGGNPYGNVTSPCGMVMVAFDQAHHGWSGGSTTTIATRGTLYGSYTTSSGYAVYVTGGSSGTYARVTVLH